jgi:hypothetical protein
MKNRVFYLEGGAAIFGGAVRLHIDTDQWKINGSNIS